MFGDEATEFLQELLPIWSEVVLERDVSETDRYGRLLRYVYLPDGRTANGLIVEAGYASQYTYPPDVRHDERIAAAQSRGRAAGAGLWSACVAASTVTATAAPTPTSMLAPCDSGHYVSGRRRDGDHLPDGRLSSTGAPGGGGVPTCRFRERHGSDPKHLLMAHPEWVPGSPRER